MCPYLSVCFHIVTMVMYLLPLIHSCYPYPTHSSTLPLTLLPPYPSYPPYPTLHPPPPTSTPTSTLPTLPYTHPHLHLHPTLHPPHLHPTPYLLLQRGRRKTAIQTHPLNKSPNVTHPLNTSLTH